MLTLSGCLPRSRITNNLVYYGFSLNTSSLSGDIFWNAFLSAAVEIPAFIVTSLLITHVGRKPVLAGGFLVAGLTSLACIPFLGREGMRSLIVATTLEPCKSAFQSSDLW